MYADLFTEKKGTMLKEKIKSIIFFRKKKPVSISKNRSEASSKRKSKKSTVQKIKMDTQIQISVPEVPSERILTAEGWRRLGIKGTIRKK